LQLTAGGVRRRADGPMRAARALSAGQRLSLEVLRAGHPLL